VFKETYNAGLKVMIDGQGADEQLAGYGGNDLSLYAGLLGRKHFLALLDEARHYKKANGGWPYGFLSGALQLNLSESLSFLFPGKIKIKDAPKIDWLHSEEPGSIHKKPANSLQENLLRQLYREPLPALLRYEDHNSMAWSVESRTPFMDYRLLEFTLGLPEQFIYKRGERKTILRRAMHGIIPPAIENRKDKMGFVTPEEVWLKGEGREWVTQKIEKVCDEFDGKLLNAKKVREYVSEIMSSKRVFDPMLWRIVCFYEWYKKMG
jgi:asparagine synthase (glutamine-hydrolysing)